jgi:hypothetical protein
VHSEYEYRGNRTHQSTVRRDAGGGCLGVDNGEQSVAPEPRAARVLKSMSFAAAR